jgi:alpha-L-arabinofuranosidase
LSIYSTNYVYNDKKIPQVSASASKNSEGIINISFCNTDPSNEAEVDCELFGININKISGRALTGSSFNEHNTFDNPNQIKPADFNEVKIKESNFIVKLPSKSIVVLSIKNSD